MEDPSQTGFHDQRQSYRKHLCESWLRITFIKLENILCNVLTACGHMMYHNTCCQTTWKTCRWLYSWLLNRCHWFVLIHNRIQNKPVNISLQHIDSESILHLIKQQFLKMCTHISEEMSWVHAERHISALPAFSCLYHKRIASKAPQRLQQVVWLPQKLAGKITCVIIL